MCKYCGKEHGMIGDVVCPFKKQFGESYKTKYIKDFHSDTWPHYFEPTWPVLKQINVKAIKMY